MIQRQKIAVLGAVFFFAAAPVVMLSFSGGPDPGNTAAPGEAAAACARAGCHVGTGNPTSGSGIEVTFSGGGTTYTPGVKQTLTVRLTSSTTNVNGFQLSIRPQSNSNEQAGDLVPTDSRTQVLCQTGSLKPCPAAAPVQFIEHTASGTSGNSWTFEWTPPAAAVGNIRVYVAGNASNSNGNTTGDRIFLNNYTLTAASSTPAPQVRAAQPVLQAFQGGERLSPGTWVEIYGTNLASSTREWAGSDFQGNRAPTSLEGVSVTIDNKPAFVRYVSPTQINVQVPDIGTGNVEVAVTNAGGTSRVTRTATAVSPALLTTPNFLVGGVQYVAALHADNATFVGRAGLIQGVAFRPARPGDVIIVYAVGCGQSNPASIPGQFFADARPLASPVQFRFGQTVSPSAPGFIAANAIGLCQFNVTVPNVASGDQDLEATVNGVPTGQGLKITVQQ